MQKCAKATCTELSTAIQQVNAKRMFGFIDTWNWYTELLTIRLHLEQVYWLLPEVKKRTLAASTLLI